MPFMVMSLRVLKEEISTDVFGTLSNFYDGASLNNSVY